MYLAIELKIRYILTSLYNDIAVRLVSLMSDNLKFRATGALPAGLIKAKSVRTKKNSRERFVVRIVRQVV